MVTMGQILRTVLHFNLGPPFSEVFKHIPTFKHVSCPTNALDWVLDDLISSAVCVCVSKAPINTNRSSLLNFSHLADNLLPRISPCQSQRCENESLSTACLDCLWGFPLACSVSAHAGICRLSINFHMGFTGLD